jgi:hypothetical protein
VTATVEKPLTDEERLWDRMVERGLTPKNPIEWAKGLVVALECTYTGKHSTDLIRNAMVVLFNHPDHEDKDPTHPDRHLTADQAIAVLQQGFVDGITPDLTVLKAINLRKKGTWTTTPLPGHGADVLPDPPSSAAPKRKEAKIVQPAYVEPIETAKVETIEIRTLVKPLPENKASHAAAIPDPPSSVRAPL